MTAKHLYNDKDLLQQIAAGDEKAFRCLFDAYWDKIYKVAITLTKSATTAEEIVQDVFLKIWLKKDQLPAVEKIDGYLFMVARNHIYNVLRSKVNEQEFVEHLEQHFLEQSSLPEQLLLVKETAELVAKAVEQLPEQQRAVYIMSRDEGLDYNAIAAKLGITRSTVKNHMTKALHFLRDYLNANRGELVLFVLLACSLS